MGRASDHLGGAVVPVDDNLVERLEALGEEDEEVSMYWYAKGHRSGNVVVLWHNGHESKDGATFDLLTSMADDGDFFPHEQGWIEWALAVVIEAVDRFLD